MTETPAGLQSELLRRHRTALIFVLAFLALDVVLLVVAYFSAERIFRPVDPSVVMGLWIAILVFGLGAFVLRRTRFGAMRLKDIAALRGVSGLIKTLQDTTIQIAFIGAAIGLMGFLTTIFTADWTSMLRAAGVSAIVLFYCYPFRSAWERTVRQLADYSSG
jgi:hypothetical protein